MAFLFQVTPLLEDPCNLCCSEVSNIFSLDLALCQEGCAPPTDVLDELNRARSSCTNPDDLSCSVGEDFRLFGASFLGNRTIVVCDEGGQGITVEIDLEVEETSFTIEGSDCSACCASGSVFDSVYSLLWNEASCVSVCQDPLSLLDCNSSDSAERLGCAHGYDLRLSGGSSRGVLWSIGSTSVSCSAGLVQAINSGGGNEEVNPLFFFLAGGGVLFVLVIAVAALSSKGKRKPGFTDLPLYRIDEEEDQSNEPNQVKLDSTAAAAHYGHFRQQMTLDSNDNMRRKDSASKASFAEKPKLGEMKQLGIGLSISKRFTERVKGAFMKKKKNKANTKKPFNVAEAKKNGMRSKSGILPEKKRKDEEGGSEGGSDAEDSDDLDTSPIRIPDDDDEDEK